jgi:hypothetical protein
MKHLNITKRSLSTGASIHFDKAQCGAILLMSNHSATIKIWSFRTGASIHFDKAQCGAILLLSNHSAATKVWSLSVLMIVRMYRNDISYWDFDTFRQSSMRRDSPTVESLSHRLKSGTLGLRYDSPAVELLSHRLKSLELTRPQTYKLSNMSFNLSSSSFMALAYRSSHIFKS